MERGVRVGSLPSAVQGEAIKGNEMAVEEGEECPPMPFPANASPTISAEPIGWQRDMEIEVAS
jgi:hypothetical protein